MTFCRDNIVLKLYNNVREGHDLSMVVILYYYSELDTLPWYIYNYIMCSYSQ